MRITRRGFLGAVGSVGGSMLAPEPHAQPLTNAPSDPRIPLNPVSLTRFVDPLPIPPIAQCAELCQSPTDAQQKLQYYRIEMQPVQVQLHRDLKPTYQWGYNGSVPGPTFETRSGQGLIVEWVNKLPDRHFLPIDHTVHGAEASRPDVRTVAHVHGAKAPPASDGYPEDWFVPGQSAIAHYPNHQDAATLWYHDHAMGITRLNIFAGLIGAFIVRDAVEDALNLPSGERDIPLILYDRTLDRDGQLLYPESGDPGAPWVPECYGNLSLCNGKIYPYLDVQPGRYRFRIVNAANTRFFHLSLSENQSFLQIGSDQGLMPQAVELKSLLLLPGERADVVIDFTACANQQLTLNNQLDQLLQFRVSAEPVKDDHPLPVQLRPIKRMEAREAVKSRMLTLGEYDSYVGTSMLMLLNGMHWDMPVTEKPVIDTVEIWNFINLTGDTHPIHLHLVRFQILDRRPFDLFQYNANKTLKYTGPAVAPSPSEAGWKDTVRVDPGIVTRIIVRFEGFAGRYVWHCHLLEHEDKEMMRPYEVIAAHGGTVAVKDDEAARIATPHVMR